MAVAFDASSNATAGGGNLSWTHTPVGTPRGVVVLIAGDTGADDVTGVTYGGVAMTEVTGSPNVKAAVEAGGTYVYFLGASIPTGPQTVTVTVSGGQHLASAVSLTASDDTEIVDTDATINSDSSANPSATLPLGARTCWCGEALFSGQNAVTGITPLSGWTSVQEVDIGTECGAVYRYNTIDSTDVTMGWTQTAEDAVSLGVAVSEIVVGGGQPAIKRYGGVPFTRPTPPGLW